MNKRKFLTLQNAAGAALLLAAAATAWTMAVPGDHQNTEDAYVDGNVIQLTPQIAGSVSAIGADNTDYVRAGQVLVQLNPVDTQLALARSEAQLAKAVRQVRTAFSNAAQFHANVTLRAADLARAQADLARRRELAGSGAISAEDIHHAQDSVNTARAALSVAQQQQASASALIDRTSIANHPDVQAAIALAFQTARAAGKAAGVLAADGKAEHYFEGGATMVGVGTDLHLLIAGADAVAARFRQQP